MVQIAVALFALADAFLRIAAEEAVKVLVWMPAYLLLVWLYARLVRRP